MTLLIDGHNLIGAGVFRDIRLSDEDDEAKLVARLRVWQSRVRRNMVVFFDRGIPGGRDYRMSGGGVEVVFAANPTEADDLIRRRLRRASRHTILVTNDDALAREAAVYGLERWRGHEFVARMAMPEVPTPEAGEEWDIRLSKEEVEEWLDLFRAARKAKLGKVARGKPRDDTAGLHPIRRNGSKSVNAKTARAKHKRPATAAEQNESASAKSAPAGNGSEKQPGKAKPNAAQSKKQAKQSRRKARKAARERRRLRG